MEDDQLAEIERQVLDRLDPRPIGTRPEVEQKVRQVLQEALMSGDYPLTRVDRARVANDGCNVLGREPASSRCSGRAYQ
jgi:hypothetical protein